MSPGPSRSWIGAVAAFAFAATLGAVPPASPEAAKPRNREESIAALRLALDQTLNLEFTDQPLQNVVNQIAEVQKINIVLDRGSLHQMGMDPNEMLINVRLKQVKLRHGLRQMVNQYNLGIAMLGDTVLITSRENAYLQQVRQHVQVNVADVPLNKVMEELRSTTGTNLVLDPRAAKETKAPITLQIDDVPLETAVKLVSSLAGLKCIRLDNLLFITTAELAEKMDGGGGEEPKAIPRELQ